MPTINYVCCLWFGERRNADPRATTDPLLFLRLQIENLTRTKHELTQITFVINRSSNLDTLNPMAMIPTFINNTPVVTIVRDNLGLSYGAFDHVVKLYGETFDYYFFIEDDYFPILDNFDKEFLAYMVGDVGYVCCLFTDHAAIATGLFKSKCLVDQISRLGKVSHHESDSYGHNEGIGQVGISHELLQNNVKIVDVADKFNSPFNAAYNTIINLGDRSKQNIVVPSQFL